MCFLRPLLHHHPAIYEALKTRHVWYNETLEYIDERAAAGMAILIAPEKPLEISRVCHDPDVMQHVYDIDRKAGETANLRELSQFKRCMQAFGDASVKFPFATARRAR